MKNPLKSVYAKVGLFIGLLFFALLTKSNAQTMAGIQGGFVYSSITVDKEYKEYNYPGIGISFGGKLISPVSSKVKFNASFDLSFRGSEFKGEKHTAEPFSPGSSTIIYIDNVIEQEIGMLNCHLPVTFTYTISQTPELYAIGGMYLSYLLSGYADIYEYYKDSTNDFSMVHSHYIIDIAGMDLTLLYNRFDVGFVGGLGYASKIKNNQKFYFELSFQQGLIKVQPDLNKGRNFAFLLNAGILFSLPDKNKKVVQQKQ